MTEFQATALSVAKRVLGGSSIVLAVVYTIGHIFIAILCVRIITGAPLELAAADALIEPVINGFWFYLLFEVFNKYKKTIYESRSGKSSKNPSPSATRTSKLAPINNKKDLD